MFQPERHSGPDHSRKISMPPCTVEIIPRHLTMLNVSASELHSLSCGSNSINLTFFGICFGAAISFGIVLFSGGISDIQKATYKMLLGAAIVLAGYLGIQSIRNHRQSRQILKNLMMTK
jgi:hypothetical protein